MNSWVSADSPTFTFWGVLHLHRGHGLNKRLVLERIWGCLKSSSAVKEFLVFIGFRIFSTAATSNAGDRIKFIIPYPIPHVLNIHRFLNMQIPRRTLIVWRVIPGVLHPLILEWEPRDLPFSALVLSQRGTTPLFVDHQLRILVNWDVCYLVLDGLLCSLHIVRRSLHLGLVL